MRTKVEISRQVRDFVRALAPEPRKTVRAGLRGLERGSGDILELEGELAGWSRLRVKTYRIVFRYIVEQGQRVARCEFAERRAVVYELFEQELKRMLASEDEKSDY